MCGISDSTGAGDPGYECQSGISHLTREVLDYRVSRAPAILTCRKGARRESSETRAATRAALFRKQNAPSGFGIGMGLHFDGRSAQTIEPQVCR